MMFDLANIAALVQRLACDLVPGWSITCALAKPGDLPPGALAMVDPHPERQVAHIVVAQHPPGEDYEETIAHELTHVMLSPIVQLVQRSNASVMLEEQIVERLCKLLTSGTAGMRRAITSAITSKRMVSPALRYRFSALAARQRNAERKRMDPKALAALAMEGGTFAAMEGVPPEVADWIKRAVEAMAGGGAAPESEAPPMREDGADPNKPEPQMREEDVPPQMREQYRLARKSTAMLLGDTMRMRLHTMRTVDGIDVDEATAKQLLTCKTVEQFEREASIVTRMAAKGGEQQRARSGARPDAPDTNGAPSIDSMTADGIPEQVAQHVRREFARGKDHGQAALTSARKYRKAATNG